MRDWSNDPRLEAAQRLRELGPIIQAHADTHAIPPEDYDRGEGDRDLEAHDAQCAAAFRTYPPTEDELRRALDERRGILIRHPDTDRELAVLS